MSRTISSKDAILLTARGVMIETIRRKEFYVLLMLCMIYVVAMLVSAVVGISNKSTIMFLLNLGITFAWVAAHLLTLLTAARQVPDELENRTIHPLLAKPLKRRDYLLGKWVAASGAGVLTFVSMLILASFPRFFIGGSLELDELLFAQSLVLTVVSIAMTAAISLLASLLVPKAMNVVGMLLILIFGQKAINMLLNSVENQGMRTLADWLVAYVPNFAKLNLFDRYTDGMTAVGFPLWGGLIVYGVLFTAAALAASILLFNRRPL